MTEEDGRTEDGKWKIEQCSVGPETAKNEGYLNTRATFTVVVDFGSWVFPLSLHKKNILANSFSSYWRIYGEYIKN